MHLLRSLLPFLAIALLALFVAACGGDSDSSDGDESRDAKSDSAKSESEIEAGSAEALEAKTGSASFAITPELTDCMAKAGFTQDATPVTGGIASWRHDDGAQVVVTPSSEVALSIAGVIGTTEAPANVDDAFSRSDFSEGRERTRRMNPSGVQLVVDREIIGR